MKIVFDIPDALGPVSVVDSIRFLSSSLRPLDMLLPGEVFTIRLEAEINKEHRD